MFPSRVSANLSVEIAGLATEALKLASPDEFAAEVAQSARRLSRPKSESGRATVSALPALRSFTGRLNREYAAVQQMA